MKQYFTLDQNDSFLVRMDVSGSNLKANWMGPVVVDGAGGVDLGIANDNRALVVPVDNDGFVRYNAMPMNNWGDRATKWARCFRTTPAAMGWSSVRYTHDTWKTGIFFAGANNKLNAMKCLWRSRPRRGGCGPARLCQREYGHITNDVCGVWR